MPLDTTAWLLPDGGITKVPDGIPYPDSPGMGVAASQVDLSGGMLNLHVIYSPGPVAAPGFGGPFTLPLSGGTIFWKSMCMLYGTVEARIKFMGAGSHSTFWLFDRNVQSTIYQSPLAVEEKDEIDIAEAVPFVYSNTTTLKQNVFGPVPSHEFTTTVSDYSTNFHTYKVVWTPTSVTWYVDGAQTNQLLTNIPTHPMFVILDIEEADAGSGPVDSGNFPQVYQVDYVKAWDSNDNLIFQDTFNGASAYVQQTILASYDFAAVENPLSDGGNFTKTNDALFTGALKVSAPNFCEVAANNTLSSAYWSGSIIGGGAWPASQFSEVRLAGTWQPTSYAFLTVRQSGATGYTYYLVSISNDAGINGWSIGVLVSGVSHSLMTGLATVATGDIWRLSVLNNDAGHPVITITQNLNVLGSFIDTNNYIMSAGAPGFGAFVGAGEGFSSWLGGDSRVIPITPSFVYSVPDCRNFGNFPNDSVDFNGTSIFDVPSVDSRTAGAPVDSRTGPPVASGTYPQNSRTPGTFGPGE